jgi:hypothetical protein
MRPAIGARGSGFHEGNIGAVVMGVVVAVVAGAIEVVVADGGVDPLPQPAPKTSSTATTTAAPDAGTGRPPDGRRSIAHS